MRNRREAARTKSSGWMVILGMLVLVVIIAIIALMNPTERSAQSVKPTPVVVAQYSDEQKHQFWELHLDRLIRGEIAGAKYSIPAINERYHTLFQRVMMRYGKPFRLEPSTSYNENDANVLAGVQMDGDTPVLRIFVPSVMNAFSGLQNARSPAWEKEFEVAMVIGTIHELEHIASGNLAQPEVVLTKSELVESETSAWAETCRYTISAFVAQGYPMGPSETYYYNGWVSCGKEDNPCWRRFIQNTYAKVLERHK